MYAILNDTPGETPIPQHFNAQEDIDDAAKAALERKDYAGRSRILQLIAAELPDDTKFTVPNAEFDPTHVINDTSDGLRPRTTEEAEAVARALEQSEKLDDLRNFYLRVKKGDFFYKKNVEDPGAWYKCDSDGIDAISGRVLKILSARPVSYPIRWVGADNDIQEFANSSEFIGLGEALDEFVEACVFNYALTKGMLAQNPDHDIYSGWPQNRIIPSEEDI